MKITAALQKLKRRCSIRKKKTSLAHSKRTTSAPFTFHDDNLPIAFSPMRTSTNNSASKYRSTPNLRSKKSVSFNRSGNLNKTVVTSQDLPSNLDGSHRSTPNRSSTSLVRQTSLNTLASSNLTAYSMEPVSEETSSDCTDTDCLVCVMLKPGLRGKHRVQIKPSFLRSFY